MTWSFSKHNTFRQCQRQWFFKYKFANSSAKDPMRKEAQRLSKLVNLKAWRGKIVDSVISDFIIPSVGREIPIDLETAQQMAWNLFQKQQLLGMQPAPVADSGFSGFLEVEYGKPPTPEVFNEAWEEIRQALVVFFKNL